MSNKELLNLIFWAVVCAGVGWILGRLALIALCLFFPIKLWWVLKAGPVGAVIGSMSYIYWYISGKRSISTPSHLSVRQIQLVKTLGVALSLMALVTSGLLGAQFIDGDGTIYHLAAVISGVGLAFVSLRYLVFPSNDSN